MSDEQPKLIILSQGFVKSAASDAVTFAILAALPWFNYRFCGGSGWINCAIAVAWFIMITSRAAGMRKKHTMTPDEARAFLDDNFPLSQTPNQGSER